MAKATKSKSNEIQQFGEYRCGSCDHDTCLIVSDLAVTDYVGTLEDGRKYSKVIRHRVQCKRCEAFSILLRYEFDPSLWQE